MNSTAAGAGMAGAAFVMMFLFMVVGIVISAIVLRWMFMVNKRLNTAEASMAILARIAKKQGVTDEEIKAILDHTVGIDRSKHIKYIVG